MWGTQHDSGEIINPQHVRWFVVPTGRHGWGINHKTRPHYSPNSYPNPSNDNPNGREHHRGSPRAWQLRLEFCGNHVIASEAEDIAMQYSWVRQVPTEKGFIHLSTVCSPFSPRWLQLWQTPCTTYYSSASCNSLKQKVLCAFAVWLTCVLECNGSSVASKCLIGCAVSLY